MNFIPRFTPQHREKCYCNCSCYCSTPDRPPSVNTKSEFVKTRNSAGRLKPRCERIADSVIPSARSQSKCSAHSLVSEGSSYSRKSSTISRASSSSQSTDLPLTDRRLQYEVMKEDFHYGPDSAPADAQGYAETLACESLMSRGRRDLESLNDFRLHNSSDCFGILSQHAINDRLGRTVKPEHVCEFRYRVSKRGLLEPACTNREGETICPGCRRVIDDETKSGRVPVVTETSASRFVLELHGSVVGDDITKSKESTKGVRMKRARPANSLALVHQPMI